MEGPDEAQKKNPQEDELEEVHEQAFNSRVTVSLITEGPGL